MSVVFLCCVTKREQVSGLLFLNYVPFSAVGVGSSSSAIGKLDVPPSSPARASNKPKSVEQAMLHIPFTLRWGAEHITALPYSRG